jgi:hypothetical protein
VAQLPRIVSGNDSVAIDGMVVGGSTVGTLAEQLVAGATMTVTYW